MRDAPYIVHMFTVCIGDNDAQFDCIEQSPPQRSTRQINHEIHAAIIIIGHLIFTLLEYLNFVRVSSVYLLQTICVWNFSCKYENVSKEQRNEMKRKANQNNNKN